MAEKEISDWARKCKERSPNRTHGFTTGDKAISVYSAWKAIKQRCSNPNYPRFEDYGGRGIKVCQRWLDSFEDFYSDMGPKPSPQHQIDRWPNPNGNYEPDNCRWATVLEQQNNKRTNVFIEFDGKRQTMANWAREFGIRLGTLHFRLKHGWEIEKALKTPTESLIEFNGRSKTMTQWAKEIGIRLGTLHYRIKSGWSAEKALTTPVHAPTP